MRKKMLGAFLAGTFVLPIVTLESVDAVAVSPAVTAPATLATDSFVEPVPVVIDEYKMRSGDKLHLLVYGHDDVSNGYAVRPDGMLTVPLIGDVNCQGRTLADVTAEITSRLSEYIVDPQVTINITGLGTTRVYVLGEIRGQGLYELDKSHTLLDAVSRAGGFTEKSAKKHIYVIRRGVNDFVAKVNMVEFLEKGADVNIELQEGDCVYLTSNHKLNWQTIFSSISNVTSYVDHLDNIGRR